jgi:hypothetical protein
MKVDPSSIWSYEEIKASGYVSKVQSWILSKAVKDYPKALTRRQFVEHIRRNWQPGFATISATSRFSELVRLGFLEKTDKHLDKKTNKQVSTWRWTGRKTPLETREIPVECPHCEGKGFVFKFMVVDEFSATQKELPLSA